MNRRFLYFSIILKFSNAITIHEALFFQTVKMSDISLLDDDAEVSIIKTLQDNALRKRGGVHLHPLDWDFAPPAEQFFVTNFQIGDSYSTPSFAAYHHQRGQNQKLPHFQLYAANCRNRE